MALEIRGIIIDKRPEGAAQLKERLESVVVFSDHLFVRSPREGLEILAEQYFEVCFISADFDPEDVNTLVRDLARLKQETPIALIQVRDDLRASELREDLAGSRFATVLSRHLTEQDAAALLNVLRSLVWRKTVKQRCQESHTMIDLVLREIDRVSKDIKRGKKRKLTRGTFSSVIRDCLDFSPIVLESYFLELEKRVEQSPPAKDVSLKIPERLFELGLPGLSNGTYEGHSLRVWEMLVEKFGEPKER